ncbi:unnamed protein product, partial [Tetraodon nigroviridis]
FRRIVLILAAPLLLLPLPLVIGTKEAQCSFVLLLMAIFWMTEAVPLAMAAMLPAILFPAFGIMTSSDVAKEYFKDFHFLLVGVICLATSIAKWGLHRRVALRLVTLVGVNPAWLMLGFMSGCAFLSMWVQNTSAVAMVMPIVEAVLQQILKASEKDVGGEDNPGLQLDETSSQTSRRTKLPLCCHPVFKSVCVCVCVCVWGLQDAESPPAAPSSGGARRDRMLCKAMCIGIAYSSNIGGISTLPGTSPNLIFAEFLHQTYPSCNCINFGNWLLLCFPVSLIMLLLTWLWLYWLFIGSDFSFLWRCRGEQTEKERAAKKVIEDECKSLGPMSSQEIFTGLVFLLMVLLWLTRAPGFIPGWASLFPQVHDLLEGVRGVHAWNVALLVGGGFALAEGAKVSGLSQWVADLLTPLGNLPVLATITIACIIVTTVTEVTSNAATVTIFLPILSALAEAIHVNPLYVLIPTTLCTSYSFLLPVSNPPNAVVFGYGHLTIMDIVRRARRSKVRSGGALAAVLTLPSHLSQVKAGIGTNVIGVLATLLAVATWGVPLFSLDTYPDWAPVHPGSNSTSP